MSSEAWGNQFLGVMPAAPDAVQGVLLSDDLGPVPAAHGVLLFSEEVDAGAEGEGNAFCYADVTVGAGATTTNFLCDWRGQFSVVCSSLEVRTRSYAPRYWRPYSPVLPIGKRYRFGAMLGFGGWHAGKFLTFTASERVLSAPLGSELVFPVPNFARRFFLRIGRTPSNYQESAEELYGAEPWWQSDVESLSVGVTRRGVYQYPMRSQSEPLTVESLRAGFDLSDGSSVTVKVRSALSAPYFVTPVFELAL